MSRSSSSVEAGAPREESTLPDARTSQALMAVTASMRPSSRDLMSVDREEIGFVLELARALHRYGTPAHRLEEAIVYACKQLEVHVEVFSTPTTIIMSFGAPSELRTRMMRVETGELNMAKLAAVDALADKVIAHRISPSLGVLKLAEIMGQAPRFRRRWVTLATGVSSAGLAVFFGGGWRDVLLAGVLGCLLGVVELLLRKTQDQARMLTVLGAAFVAAVAGLAAANWRPISPTVVTIAGIISLLPGMRLTIAMTELATMNLISGTARLTSAVITLLELVVGVALGEHLANALVKVPHLRPLPLGGYWEWVALVVSGIAVAIVVQANVRAFAWIVAACVVGYLGAAYGTRVLGAQLGVLVGATGLGVLTNIYARALKRPAQVVLVPAMLILVPGSLGLRGMTSMLARDTLSGVDTVFAMFITAMALVAGLLLANAVVSPRRIL